MLAGNFAIGCGVMVTAGSLNNLVSDLQVSVVNDANAGALSEYVFGAAPAIVLAGITLGPCGGKTTVSPPLPPAGRPAAGGSR